MLIFLNLISLFLEGKDVLALDSFIFDFVHDLTDQEVQVFTFWFTTCI